MNGWRPLIKKHLIERQSAGISNTTLEHSARWLKRFMAWCESQQLASPAAVTPADIEAFRALMCKTPGPRCASFSPSSIHQAMRALRALFFWAEKREVILLNPMADVVVGRVKPVLPPVMSIHDVERLLEAADDGSLLGIRNRAILETLYDTGIRRSELLGLQLTSLDLSERKIRVMGKGSVERFAPVGDVLAAVLERYLRHCRPHLAGRMNDAALFLTANGQCYQSNSLTQMIHALGKRVGLRVTPHALRHAFAVHLLECGADFYEVQRLLGHRSPKSTQIYLDIAKAAFARMVRRCHPRGRGRSAEKGGNPT